MFEQISKELKIHAPFTLFGVVTGMIILFFSRKMPFDVAYHIFYILHPLHILLSALVTASMYKLHKCSRKNGKYCLSKHDFWVMIFIGYIGSIGISTISDSIIPYLGEMMLSMPNRGIHIGFIEKWWLVNPLAIAGIVIANFWPTTKFPHAGHVLLSTWASLFHFIMAMGIVISIIGYMIIFVFLFLAVWIPCCLSDIIFPLLFVKKRP